MSHFVLKGKLAPQQISLEGFQRAYLQVSMYVPSCNGEFPICCCVESSVRCWYETTTSPPFD